MRHLRNYNIIRDFITADTITCDVANTNLSAAAQKLARGMADRSEMDCKLYIARLFNGGQIMQISRRQSIRILDAADARRFHSHAVI